jgi:hypothetical protein
LTWSGAGRPYLHFGVAMVRVKCPHCEYHYDVEEKMIGQEDHCPKCTKRFRMIEEHPTPFVRRRFEHPALTLLFYVIWILVLVAVGAALVYYVGPLFKAGF